MGYDMHMLRKPAVLPQGYRPQYEGMPDYFRLNTTGMPIVRIAMVRAGVLDTRTPHPDLEAVWPPAGLTVERYEEIEAHINREELLEPAPSAQEFTLFNAARSRLDLVLATRSPHQEKVPWFKFTSNDGWIVSPEECKAIAFSMGRGLSRTWRLLPLRLLFSRQRLDAIGLLRDWSNYNQIASECGGYRVR